MGCNSSKDGTNPDSGMTKKESPEQQQQQENNTNTNQENQQNSAFMPITDLETEPSGQTQNGDNDNNLGGQLIINEDTENKSMKDVVEEVQRRDTPVAEEDKAVQDGDITVEQTEGKNEEQTMEQTEIKADEKSGGGQGAAENTNQEDQQQLEGV